MDLFYDVVYAESHLLCDNELGVDTEILEPFPDILLPATVLTYTDMEKLKLVNLEEELKKRACSIKRVKEEPNLRLREVVDTSSIPFATNITDGGKGLRHIGGTQLRKPTVQPAPFVEGEYDAIIKITI